MKTPDTGQGSEGYSFQDLYDVKTVTVKPEYFKLYEQVKSELSKRNLNYDG